MLASVVVLVWALAAAAVVRAADWQFRLVAGSGLPATGLTFGGTWADLDGDGDWDLVLSRHADGVAEFYLGQGDLRFRGPTAADLPAGLLDHHGTAACDFDGDGDWDLFLSVGAERGHGNCCKQLWTNRGGLVFAAGIPCDQPAADPAGRGRGALWLRLDPAPLPQLLLLNYLSPPRLFGRDAAGTWLDLGGRLDRPAEAWWTVAVAEDFDGDGAVDLFVAGGERRVLRNIAGRLVGQEIAALPLIGAEVSAAAAGDVDGDGDPDLVLGLRGGALWLLRNESGPGEIRFGQVVGYPSLPLVSEPVSVVLADLDNDGRLDLAVAQRGADRQERRPLLARGAGDGTFTALEPDLVGLVAVPSRAMGLWALDLDRDGDLDLVVTNGEEGDQRTVGAVQVYENLADTPGLTVELQARPGAAPHGLGALVSLGPGEGVRSLRVRSVANPWNATVLPVHFGLGTDDVTREVRVDWPCGAHGVTRPASSAGAVRVLQEGR